MIHRRIATVIALIFAFSCIGVYGLANTAEAQSSSNSLDVNLTVMEDSSDDDDDDGSKFDGDADGGEAIKVTDVERGVKFLEITWETRTPSEATVSWGKTDSTELDASRTSLEEAQTHTSRIEDLESGTSYDIELKADMSSGPQRKKRLTYRTNIPTAPESVTGLQVNQTADDNARLQWQLPDADSFDYIRIVRSQEFFPPEPMRGELIFEGRTDAYVDKNVSGGSTHYYSVYVRNESGKWSAPAIASVSLPGADQPDLDDGEQKPEDDSSDRPTSTLPEVEKVSELGFSNLLFTQNNKTARKDGKVTVDADREFTIGLSKEQVPEVLKTLLITLHHPHKDSTFSFLMRKSPEAEYYTATVDGLPTAGTYDLDLDVLDYKHRQAKQVSGQIVATTTEYGDDQPVVSQIDELSSADTAEFTLFLFGLILFGGLIIVTSWFFGAGSKRQQKA